MLDERFITHRYKATRFAMVIGVILIAAFFSYEFIVHRTIRWDLFIILCATAVAKVGAMMYYRRTN